MNVTKVELRIWSHLLKKFLTGNFIFCAECSDFTLKRKIIRRIMQYADSKQDFKIIKEDCIKII